MGRPAPVSGSNRRPVGSKPVYVNVSGGYASVCEPSMPTETMLVSSDAPLNGSASYPVSYTHLTLPTIYSV